MAGLLRCHLGIVQGHTQLLPVFEPSVHYWLVSTVPYARRTASRCPRFLNCLACSFTLTNEVRLWLIGSAVATRKEGVSPACWSTVRSAPNVSSLRRRHSSLPSRPLCLFFHGSGDICERGRNPTATCADMCHQTQIEVHEADT